MLPVSLDTALQPLPAAPLAADLSTVAETRLPSLAGMTRAGARQGARRHRRARARDPHARRAALALDLLSRGHLIRGDDQCRQEPSRRTDPSFQPRPPADRLRAGFHGRHAKVAVAHAFHRKHDRGAEIEAVYIPESDRGTLCISSQVGCTLTCTFCHTGTQKLVRNLTAAEIVAQLMVARDRLGDWPGGVRPTDGLVPDAERAISNVVLMGMGEPLYNFENVRDAMDVVSDGDGLSLSQAADHAIHLGRRPDDRARRRRDRLDARHLAARGARRPAQRAGAAQQKVSDPRTARRLPQLSRRLAMPAASPSST